MPLQAAAEDVLEVSGALTFESVPALYAEARNLINGRVRAVDLSAVTRVDSAGLALLLEWQATARRRGARIEFRAVPADLVRLAELSESDDLLGLARGDGQAGAPDEHGSA